MPTEIEATYRVVTPLFCAGADQRRAEVRLPSFKGVLRFWWRALAWSQYSGDPQRIQQQEDTLFGSAAGGQSRVSMRLSPPDGQPVLGKDLSVGPSVRYLGFGVMERGPEKERGCLQPPLQFTIRLRERDLDDQQLKLLQRAMIALGTIGGMGARSRKGFGSLVIESLRVNGRQEWREPQTMTDLGGRIKALHSAVGPHEFPQYTALSKRTRHVLVSRGQIEPLQLLDLIGDRYKNAIRTCPRRGRIVFGLPRGRRNDRRASPLFIHIHECGDTPVVVLSFFPAQFLHEGKSDIPEDELFQPIHNFLDDLSNLRGEFTAWEVLS